MTVGQATEGSRPKASSGGAKKLVESTVVGLAIALVAGVAGLAVAFRPFTIPSSSMEPTLVPGDYVITSTMAYGFGHRPQRGEIVIYRGKGAKPPNYIKRVIGLPGEHVQLIKGVVYVNGAPLRRDPLSPGFENSPFGVRPVGRFRETLPDGRSYTTFSYGSDGEAEDTGVYAIPSGRYFVLGDNRDNSMDSRFPESVGPGGGYVALDHLQGRAVTVVSRSGDDKGSGGGLHIRSLK
jgi:signal peptidase I